ncbi:hypothetical protein A3J41_00515 [candidate division TM6 bacterium RIFCSPHIGHO2_12_FULL_38_8]|nr:MAG: hypothetical protein A3J41_00515 [candidate division TM6 bacterium RIFCSPHIGHO2_12_FULL_38_8]
MKLKVKVHYIKDDFGKIADVSLSVKDFEKLIDELSDLHDLHIVHERKDEKTIPYDEIRKALFGNVGKK